MSFLCNVAKPLLVVCIKGSSDFHVNITTKNMCNYSPVVNNQFMFSKHQYTSIYTKNVNVKFKSHANVTGIMPILLKITHGSLQMSHTLYGQINSSCLFENIFSPPCIIPRNCFKYPKISTFQDCLIVWIDLI